jgi:hypothetical protein
MASAVVERQSYGLSWVMRERMARASHALVAKGRVWVVDPVDEPAAMAAVAELGEPAGVLQMLDRHNRDCAAIAARLGVECVVNPDALPGTPFELVPIIRWPGWRETALWWPAEKVLVVPEAVGAAPAFAVGSGPVGVHPMIRLVPPRTLRQFTPRHLLMGHGRPVHGSDAANGLRDAIAHSRRDIPRLALKLPALIRSARYRRPAARRGRRQHGDRPADHERHRPGA